MDTNKLITDAIAILQTQHQAALRDGNKGMAKKLMAAQSCLMWGVDNNAKLICIGNNTWHVPSESGEKWYAAYADGCSCQAGEAHVTCKHQLAAVALNAAVGAEPFERETVTTPPLCKTILDYGMPF